VVTTFSSRSRFSRVNHRIILKVIEHFRGVKFNPPVTRLKETVEIINILLPGTPLNYQGKLFKLSRGFKLRFEGVRKHIPHFG
jgi:5,10-methylenetetrahydromethanopterin reductase